MSQLSQDELVIVFGKTTEEVIFRLQIVFQRLLAARLTLKAKKCNLFKESVLYLGHVMSSKGYTRTLKRARLLRNGLRLRQ